MQYFNHTKATYKKARTMKFILILIVAAYITVVDADSLDVNLGSYHTDQSYNYNSVNLGLGYTKTLTDVISARAGFYKNSFYKTSYYAGLTFEHKISDWSVGLNVGLVTGYDNINETVTTRCPEGTHRLTVGTISQRECTTSNGFKNLNKYQFFAYPTATYNITDKHAVTFGLLPIKQNVVVGLQYRFRL